MITAILFLIAACAFAAGYGGAVAVATVMLLSVMEISLSFDNAVINASVLRTMHKRWQHIFLTWGMLVAVFGMRLLFPLLIVAGATDLNIAEVAMLALNDPQGYAQHVKDAHVAIASFGAMFLLMVFLSFVCDEEKDTHWLVWPERHMTAIGKMEAIEAVLALVTLLAAQMLLPLQDRAVSLTAGIVGLVAYMVIKGIMGLLFQPGKITLAMSTGLVTFFYLEVLDASFSLDGVVGAFAISHDIVLIMLGLGVGALFVRTLTVWLVQRGALEEFIYLEHGAHWGIGALATIMLISTITPVSEIVTGLIGVGVIAAALLSSIMHNRKNKALVPAYDKGGYDE